ncbi:MAG: hypothetical protein WC889_17215 [Myxococcota bacterium]|jgi:hypothetical protein
MCNQSVSELIASYPETGKMPCPAAHLISVIARSTPAIVGKTLDDLKIKITYCQLGLFGYGRKGMSSYKIVNRPVEVGESFLAELKKCSPEGRITCAELWRIADTAGVFRAEAGAAAESLKLKVKGCQLGAF